ncbi:AAA family ATPase [Moritella sp.]|uniref:AAA family ATPase n=1 Tax=Moritella sp. TaxID=78556 RepID=UPI0025D2F66F|nr:AAA family ATPase [Moritella sp.]MCJ8351387.1 ATP-binding protein [Moritella sp.]
MKFKLVTNRQDIPSENVNTAYLKTDTWNDFSFETMFHLSLFDDRGSYHEIGRIKIGFKGQTISESTYSKLDKVFPKLNNDYFSVGETIEFYTNLSKLPSTFTETLLTALRDIVFTPSHIENIKEEEVFKSSLLRDHSLTTIKGQLFRELTGKAELTNFNFSFIRFETENLAPIKLDVDVFKNSTPSTNIHALIGRNGSGKTTILNGMIQAITAPDDPIGQFIDTEDQINVPIDNDYFSRLISVSFSAFDPFTPPEEQSDPAKGTCYSYIGLKSKEEGCHLTISELREDFVKSLIDCFRKKDKKNLWRKAIKRLGSDENFASMDLFDLEEIYKKLKTNNKLRQVDGTKFKKLYIRAIESFLLNLSSGHAIVLFTITKLVSTIEEKTLVLLDEPEGHLHPPLLSAFIRTLSELLIDLNGVAIIATHSPVVLQEVPKSCVWKINRVGKTMKPYRPDIETFGENVGVLTREVFGLEVVTSGYCELLSKLVKANKSYDEIVTTYKNQLGLEARIALKTMVVHRDKGLGK